MSQDNPKTPLHQMSLFGPEPGSSVSSASITPSAYQEAIFEFVLNGQGDGLINAVAGAGKTWVLVQAAQLIRLLPGPRRRATFAAFNRHIADTLKARLKVSSQ